MLKLKLSIVLPIFDEAKFLTSCLDSLFLQDRHPDEILCVLDNRTRDSSEKICREYPVRIIYTNPGKLTARDAGIRWAKGDVIVACDADTTYPSVFLREIDDLFKDAQIVAASGMTDDISRLVPLHFRWKMMGMASAFRKRAYLRVGGFDLKIDQSNHRQTSQEEERHFYRKLVRFGKVGKIGTPVHSLRQVMRHSDGFRP